MQEIRCTVVTPERTVLNEKVDFVAMTMQDGELGVAPGRRPMIGRLGYGELRIRQEDETSRYYVDGGFVQVQNNRVVILTGNAVPADQIDVATARIRLKKGLAMKAPSPEAIEIRDRTVAQARGQLRVAGERSMG